MNWYQKIHRTRSAILSNMVTFLNPIYRVIMPKNPTWKIKKADLIHYKEGTLGAAFYQFLDKNGFDLLPFLETHDVYHVLLDYKPDIVDEARMYFFLFGNGKYSFEVISTVGVSLLLLPDYWADLFRHFKRGRQANYFHHWEFQTLFNEDLSILKAKIFN